jgi:hypothetical protein
MASWEKVTSHMIFQAKYKYVHLPSDLKPWASHVLYQALGYIKMCGNHLVVTLVVADMKLEQYMAPTHGTKTKMPSWRAWASPKTEKLEKGTCFGGVNFCFTVFNLVLTLEVVLVCSAGVGVWWPGYPGRYSKGFGVRRTRL